MAAAASPWSLHANALNLMAQRGETTAMRRAIESGSPAARRKSRRFGRILAARRTAGVVVLAEIWQRSPSQAPTSTKSTRIGSRS